MKHTYFGAVENTAPFIFKKIIAIIFVMFFVSGIIVFILTKKYDKKMKLDLY